MKWILGTFHLYEGRVQSEEIQQMVSRIISPEKIEVASLALESASFALANTPNLSGKNPKIYKYNHLYLAGDIRLDNRQELLTNCINNGYSESVEDEMLVLYLYDLYGKDAVKHFLGEFVFVIWDDIGKSVFTARDQMGVKTLFWVKRGDLLWVASDIFLLENIFSMDKLNMDYFQDFYLSNGSIDSIITPYRDVHRIPSASWVWVDRQRLDIHNYWDITDECGEIRYKSLDQYQEHFLELLENAVSARLATVSSNAIMMSGGLDSTTVFAIAKHLEEKHDETSTFPVCGVFDRLTECDEREYIDLVLKMYNVRSYNELCDDYGIFKDFPNDSPWTYEPNVNAASYAFTKGIMSRARSAGATNILTGYAGDHVLGGSEGILADLLGEFQLTKVLRESFKWAKAFRLSVPQLLWKYALAPHLGAGWYQEIKENRNRQFIDKLSSIPSFNQKDFYRQLSGTKSHIYGDRVIGHEVGIESQHPFLDRKLVEYLFRIPGDIRLWDTKTKYLLRHSMKNHLPEQILQRTGKTAHLSLTFQGLRECWPKLYEVIKHARIASMGFVRKDEWQQILFKWRQGQEVREDFWILLTMEIWLYRYENQLNLNPKNVNTSILL